MLILDCEIRAYPDHWEADQSVQGHKDDKYCVRRLELSPEEDGVDVVPHVVHGEHQEDTHHHHADAPHYDVGDASMHILAAPESINLCSLHRLYPHFLFLQLLISKRLASFMTLFMSFVFSIKRDERLKWKVYLWSIWGGFEIWRFASSSLLILLFSGDISSIMSVKEY